MGLERGRETAPGGERGRGCLWGVSGGTIFLAKPSAILPPASISEKPPSFFIFTVFTIAATCETSGNQTLLPKPPGALHFPPSSFRQPAAKLFMVLPAV